MFVILVTILTIVSTNALIPATIKTTAELNDQKVKEVISKYVAKIPDIQEQHVIDERLSRVISHYFKGKLSSFPLYKVSVKIDRNAVLIPWTLGDPNATIVDKPQAPKIKNKKNQKIKKRYKFEKIVKPDTGTEATSGKLVENKALTPVPTVTISSPIKNTTM